MRNIIRSIGLLLVMISFISTAYADVISPHRPHRPHGPHGPHRPHGPHKPHRPRIHDSTKRPHTPVLKYYEKRNAELTVLEKADDSLLILRVTLPGPCKWSYIVDDQSTGTRFESNTYDNVDFDKETEEKVLKLNLPPAGKMITFRIKARFSLYAFKETRFGPKLYDDSKKEKLRYVEHTYELNNENGRYIVKEI